MQSKDIKVGEDYALRRHSWQGPVRAHVIDVVRIPVHRYNSHWYKDVLTTLEKSGHKVQGGNWCVGVTPGNTNTFVVFTTPDKAFFEGTKFAVGRQLDCTWAEYEERLAKLKASNEERRAQLAQEWEVFDRQLDAVGQRLRNAGFGTVIFEVRRSDRTSPPTQVTVRWANLLKALHVDGD
jgi:hypothetical protein